MDRDQDRLGQAPTMEVILLLGFLLPLQPWFWRTILPSAHRPSGPGHLQFPTCSLSMASSGPIWGSALGENGGSSSPLCAGGDEGETGAGGEDIAGRAPPGLPSSTFRPGRSKKDAKER